MVALVANKRATYRSQDSDLSQSQAQALGAIKALWNRLGLPPTLEEIGSSLGVSKATARAFVIILERKGHISRQPGQFRSIRILERAA